MKKLDKLNIAHGYILPSPISGAPIRAVTLPITLLSLFRARIQSPLHPSSLPLLRSLHLDEQRQAWLPIRLLLPRLNSLSMNSLYVPTDFRILVQEPTSLTSLSIREYEITALDDTTMTIIKEKTVELRVIALAYGNTIANNTLAAILCGSKAMKKLILNGVQLGPATPMQLDFLETLKIVKDVCKKKKIELWKENFDAGNGKVNLEI
jgi:hypothetical protein